MLRELTRTLPGERFLYVGDTARVPYGTKSRETVTRYSIEIANFLITRHDIKMLVAACNTASSLSLPVLRKIYKIPVVGMVDPCVRRVASLPKRECIGVIGTAGTIRSGAYENALRSAVPAVRVVSRPCPLLVALTEEGWVDTPVTRAVIAEYLAPYRSEPPDALILGCTHYPVLKSLIREFLGEATVLIDSGEEAARVVDVLLSEGGRKREGGSQGVSFLVTDDPDHFRNVGESFYGAGMDNVEKVTL